MGTNGKRITVTIDPRGRSTVEAHGYDGCGCTEATKPIEQALGGDGAVRRDYKPEFYNSEDTEQHEYQQEW